MSAFVKASSMALQAEPAVNSMVDGTDQVYVYSLTMHVYPKLTVSLSGVFRLQRHRCGSGDPQRSGRTSSAELRIQVFHRCSQLRLCTHGHWDDI